MIALRFNSQEQKEKQFVAALKQNVNRYFKENKISTKANAAMVIKTIALLLMYLLPFVLLLVFPLNGWQALLAVVVMGIGVAGVGMGVMHDATHGAYSRHPWVNNMLSGTLYLLGSNVLNWKLQHNVLHHTYTNISGLDEDIESKGPIRLSYNMPLKKFHRYQHLYAVFFYGLMTLAMLTNDFTRLRKYAGMGLLTAQKKELKSEFLKMMARKLVYLSVILGLPIWLTDFSVAEVLLGFFIMHWVASIILSLVFQMAHVVEDASQFNSEKNIGTDWHVHQLKTTSNFARNNRLVSWFVGGLNFQVEHHLFPGICHIHYRQLAPIVEKTAKDYGISYHAQPSFRAALVSHFTQLRKLGTVSV